MFQQNTVKKGNGCRGKQRISQKCTISMQYMRKHTKKLLKTGVIPAVGNDSEAMTPNKKTNCTSGWKKSANVAQYITETHELEIETELSLAAALCCAEKCWDTGCYGRWQYDIFMAWKREITEVMI